MGLELAAPGLSICIFFGLRNAVEVRRFHIKIRVSVFSGKIRSSGSSKLTFLQARIEW